MVFNITNFYILVATGKKGMPTSTKNGQSTPGENGDKSEPATFEIAGNAIVFGM